MYGICNQGIEGELSFSWKKTIQFHPFLVLIKPFFRFELFHNFQKKPLAKRKKVMFLKYVAKFGDAR